MRNEKTFWFRWMLNYSFGELLGIGAAALMGRFLFMGYYHFSHHATSLLNAVVLSMAGTVEGLIIGYIQWKSLSRFITGFNIKPWVITTTIASITGWILILPPAVIIIFFFAKLSLINHYNSILYAILAGMAFGSVIGFSQFFILRNFFKGAMFWIVANAISWGLSFLIVYAALHFFSNSLYDLLLVVIACILSGLMQGLVTGTSLHFFMGVKKDHERKTAHVHFIS